MIELDGYHAGVFIALVTLGIGVFIGAFLVTYGYKLGFKASYEIRGAKGDEDTDQGLFPPTKEPAEFDLLEKSEIADEDEGDT